MWFSTMAHHPVGKNNTDIEPLAHVQMVQKTKNNNKKRPPALRSRCIVVFVGPTPYIL